MNLFTTEDLLEYYYKETSQEKSCGIILALENNWALRQKFEVICQGADRLDKSIFSPRTGSVNALLNYAASVISTPVE